LTATSTNNPVLNNGAFWYFRFLYSFGFAPNKNISLSPDQDTFDCDSSKINCPDTKRLSWIMYSNRGGWRLGNLVNLNNDTYRKILILSYT
jgi:hypothetical protein